MNSSGLPPRSYQIPKLEFPARGIVSFKLGHWRARLTQHTFAEQPEGAQHVHPVSASRI